MTINLFYSIVSALCYMLGGVLMLGNIYRWREDGFSVHVFYGLFMGIGGVVLGYLSGMLACG